jgi:vanillate O-demethylase monooxygenase subunit
MTFLRDTWYCAGWSTDVTDAPTTKTFLGEPVLLYRTAAGRAVALDNRCPHRFAPLHQGQRHGDVIACPYHGLQFDAEGRCVHNPHGDGKVPQAARLRTYPLCERDGIVWIWMGDPALADASKVLDAGFMNETQTYAIGTGHLAVKANYLLVMDNLLDLTHAPFLHAGSVGGKPEDSIGGGLQVGFFDDAVSVTSTYRVDAMKPTPQLQPLYPHERGDFRVTMRWQPASALSMRLSMTPCGEADGSGVVLPLLHLLTPIDDERTHYFFALGRNVALDSPEAHAGMLAFARQAFEEEDEPMIAACQQQMGTPDLLSLRPVLLATDAATMKARRHLQGLIAQEQGG